MPKLWINDKRVQFKNLKKEQLV